MEHNEVQEHEQQPPPAETGRGGSPAAIRGVLNRTTPAGLAHWGGPRPGTSNPPLPTPSRQA